MIIVIHDHHDQNNLFFKAERFDPRVLVKRWRSPGANISMETIGSRRRPAANQHWSKLGAENGLTAF
jgi:hypothetical protein